MTCLSELVCSMYADGALAGDEAAAVEHHLDACATCREHVAALTRERRLLVAALAHEPEPVAVPAFRGSARRRGALAAAGLVAALTAGPFVLEHLLERLGALRLLTWLDPIATSALVNLAFETGISVLTRGNQIMASFIETIGSSVVLALLAWAVFAMLKRTRGAAVLASLALAVLVLPDTGHALDLRRADDGTVSVPAGETVDDTLIAFGRRVEIEGTVTGDVVAFAESVQVRGAVEGQLITFARNVNVDGEIGGGVIGFAQSLDLGRANVGRNLFGFAQQITTYADSRVQDNAVLFGQRLELAGPVERDVMGFAGEIGVRGSVGGDLTARGGRLVLEAPARIGGDVVAYVPAEDAVDVSSAAVVGGMVRTEISDVDAPEIPFTTLGFYFGQAVRLAAAFVAGLILLWLVPTLRATSLDDGMAALTAAGIGLVALVATPIIAVIVAVTVVGLPLAVLGFVSWLIALYFAKIVLAHFVGRRLFEATGQEKHFALALLVGLLLLLVVVNLPFVGGLLNFVLTITGLGMLVIWLSRLVQGRSPGNGGAAAAA